MPLTSLGNDYPNLANGPVKRGLTALAGGGNPGAPTVDPGFSIVTTVGTSADSLQMPVSRPNLSFEVSNYSATTCWLYVNEKEPTALFEVPPSGSAFTAGAHLVLTTGLNARIVCGVAGTWTVLN